MTFQKLLVRRDHTITPQIFQLVKFAGLRVENVNDNVKIVKANPIRMAPASSGFGQLSQFLLHALLHLSGDRCHLSCRITFTDEEEFRRSFLELTQVDADNIFTFDVLDTVQDDLQPGFRLRRGFSGGFSCRCIQNY